MPRSENIQNALRRAAKKLGSQAGLAERIGVSEGTLSKWLSGTAEPKGNSLLKIQEELGISSQDFNLDTKEFELFLSNLFPAIVKEGSLSELAAIKRHKSAWSSLWPFIKGNYKYFYTQRDGRVEISEISFVASHRDGIVTRMYNWDVDTKSRQLKWDYEGLSYIVDGYVYSVLSELKSANELFFMIFRMPTGAPEEPLFGHLLVKGTKRTLQRTAVSPCVLVRDSEIIRELYGTFEAKGLIDKGVLTDDILAHLTDAPTLALRDKVSVTAIGE